MGMNPIYISEQDIILGMMHLWCNSYTTLDCEYLASIGLVQCCLCYILGAIHSCAVGFGEG